jgi:hypothetical protein
MKSNSPPRDDGVYYIWSNVPHCLVEDLIGGYEHISRRSKRNDVLNE